MSRQYLLEQVDDAAVVQLYADGFSALPLDREDARLASVSGGAGRARHLLRPALRAQPRDARDARGDPHASRRRIEPRRAGGDPALHEAVLDQHRPAQQPHGPQVRARSAARGASRAPRSAAAAGARFRSQGETLDAMLDAAAAAVLRPGGRSDGHEQDARRRPRHPDRQREQPLRRRLDGAISKSFDERTGSTRGW